MPKYSVTTSSQSDLSLHNAFQYLLQYKWSNVGHSEP